MSEDWKVGQRPADGEFLELIEFTLTRRQPVNPLLDRGTDDQLPDFASAPGEPTLFAVDIAGVMQVIRLPAFEPSFSKRPEVIGVFQMQGIPVPAIHLARALGFSTEPAAASAQVIMTELQGGVAGFVVAGARRVRRVRRTDIIPPQNEIYSGITGIVLDEKKRFIFVLDLAKVFAGFEADFKKQSAPTANRIDFSELNTIIVPTAGMQESPRPVVVIADDSATARKALTEIISKFDCRILVCGDGEQAWQECLNLEKSSEHFMVIAEAEMPRLDGYALARRVKSDTRFAAVPFLLHAGLTGQINRERAVASGADAFIGKFNRRDLFVAVDACLKALAERECKAS